MTYLEKEFIEYLVKETPEESVLLLKDRLSSLKKENLTKKEEIELYSVVKLIEVILFFSLFKDIPENEINLVNRKGLLYRSLQFSSFKKQLLFLLSEIRVKYPIDPILNEKTLVKKSEFIFTSFHYLIKKRDLLNCILFISGLLNSSNIKDKEITLSFIYSTCLYLTQQFNLTFLNKLAKKEGIPSGKLLFALTTEDGPKTNLTSKEFKELIEDSQLYKDEIPLPKELIKVKKLHPILDLFIQSNYYEKDY